jgi:hypothetical protein
MTTGSARAMLTVAVPAADRARLRDLTFSSALQAGCARSPRRSGTADSARLPSLLSRP